MRISSITKNAGKACNNRLYRHIRTFEKIVKNYFVIYAEKRNRKKRGIYIVDTVIYNADAVGAYNILRKYHAVSGKEIDMPVTGLSSTKTIKVAV